jgi:hypothetical protein
MSETHNIEDGVCTKCGTVFKQTVSYTVEVYLEDSDEVISSDTVAGFIGDPILVTLSDIDGYTTPEINEVFASLSDTNDGIIKLIYIKNKVLDEDIKTNDDNNQSGEDTSSVTDDNTDNTAYVSSQDDNIVYTSSQDDAEQSITESSVEVVTVTDSVSTNYSGLNKVDEQSQYVTSPKTDDESDMQIYLILCIISLGAIVVITRRLVTEVQCE